MLVEIIRGINAEGITVIWIEHVVRALTSLVDRMLCLYGGQFVGDGDPASVLANPKVREIYLGSDINTSDGHGSAGPGRHHPMSEAVNGARHENASPLLEVRDLVVHHGQLRALSGISLQVFPGEVYAIIGANGAGKSTLLRTIAGLHSPTEGSIVYDGKDVTRLRPEKRATAGIVMVPEGRRLFPSLTLEENLKVGATYARNGPWTIERVYEVFPWMTDRRSQRTAQMSGGEQQSVAIGRALVANPRVLMLDELSLGLAPVIVAAHLRRCCRRSWSRA